MPAPHCNSPQINNTNVLAICSSATHVTGMKLNQDPTLPMTSHHTPVEEAMLFKLQCVQRVLAVGSSGSVYIARYTSLPTVHASVLSITCNCLAEKCIHAIIVRCCMVFTCHCGQACIHRVHQL